MDNTSSKIEKLIDKLIDKSLSFVKKDDLVGTQLVDKLEKKSVDAQYGQLHLVAALIVFQSFSSDRSYEKIIKSLLENTLHYINSSNKLKDYHFDFNNFSMCIISEYLKCKDLKKQIQQVIINSDDSRHNTINWLPMRIYVNSKRHEWTNNKKYIKKNSLLIKKLQTAFNENGSIDDLLPKGSSYNLQYNITTLANLVLLPHEIRSKFDIDKSYLFLKNLVLNDYDINYQGRGTNQIFAWGPWMFLNSFYNDQDGLTKSISYLSLNFEKMLLKDNIFLNEYDGNSKLFWWDYHYSSVYTTHFLFWLVLTLKINKDPSSKKLKKNKSSVYGNFKRYKNKNYDLIIFKGYRKYLSENGPLVSALWTKKSGQIMKGSFGAWGGDFGNKYSFGTLVMRNYLGLINEPAGQNYLPIIKKIKDKFISPSSRILIFKCNKR